MNKNDLHEYQIAAIEHILKNHHGALFLDMGLGKTVSTLTALKTLMFEELEIKNVLVIAPKRVADSVWSDEVDKWEHLQGFTISKIQGNEKQRRAALKSQADIYTIGRDNVAWLCGLFGGNMLPFDMLVIDELSSFKNASSIRFKALKGVQPSFKRVVGLTGTPAPNGLTDLWSQIYLLDRGERLGKFEGHYKTTYFKPDKRNESRVFTYKCVEGADKVIHSKIGDICMSMLAKDYLSLPPRIDNIIEIHFTKELKDRYDSFEEELVLELFDNDKVISAVNAAALSNKLLQFANGAVYDESKKWHEVHELKIDVLKEIIDDANGKSVLVAWTYRHDLERLQLALSKYKPRELKTDMDIKAWNAGEIQVMLMHPASGGHGLNLQHGGNIIVWFGQTWSLELEQQFNARLDRQGQKESVIVHKLVMRDTIDEDVIASQRRKDEIQSGLMSAVKARINKYLKT